MIASTVANFSGFVKETMKPSDFMIDYAKDREAENDDEALERMQQERLRMALRAAAESGHVF